jgi:hypothetical protein
MVRPNIISEMYKPEIGYEEGNNLCRRWGIVEGS